VIVTGAATSLKITNTTTGDKLDFTGSTIGTGTVYTIDTRYGYKTVTDGAGANQLSKLTTDSNLATFRLIPGDNSINVTGTGLDSNSKIVLQYNTRYIGV
jgi:phage-related protein